MANGVEFVPVNKLPSINPQCSMNTSPEQADQRKVSKIPINIVTFTLFDGEIPKEEVCKMQWSPIQGALLVAGIQMTGFLHPQALEDSLRFANCDIWRINRFRYVWAKWCSSFDPTCAVTPSEFLEWYENNPVPPLDYTGSPIKSRASVSIPAEIDLSLEADSVGNAKVTLRTSKSDSKKKYRNTSLQDLIARAITITNSEEPTVIFHEIYKWAEAKDYSLIFINEAPNGLTPAIESSNDSGKNRAITLQKVRRALKRMKDKISY